MRTKTPVVTILVVLLVGGMSKAGTSITIDTVTVGDPGNKADTPHHSNSSAGVGSVAYTYNIGKYEVTAGQYTAFLNAVAATDNYGLYNTDMWTRSYGCKIRRTGSSGAYKYEVASDYANRPVNFVSWGDAARFANWLHNGQPIGAQGSDTTEDGAYYLNGATSNEGLAVVRKANWKWAVTSEDEWYKAAYYKGGSANAGYWYYPTQSNTYPAWELSATSQNAANYRDDVKGLLIGDPYYRTEVGAFRNSDSAYGTFDQGGNVYEWNESGSSRGIRGGYYGDGLGMETQSRSSNVPPTFEREYGGFRVAAMPAPVPEPVTMTAVGIGIAGLGGYIRRRVKAAK